MDFIIIALIAGVAGWTGYILAERNGRSPWGWAVGCFLVPLLVIPLFALGPADDFDPYTPHPGPRSHLR